jgi:hypothetical protein
MGRSRALVVAFAIAGLFLVAGVTYLASTLVSQPIGLTSEPATLGESLAPKTTRSTTTARPVTTTVTTTTTVPATTQTVPPTTTTTLPTTTLPSGDADDHGGHGSDGDSDDD